MAGRMPNRMPEYLSSDRLPEYTPGTMTGYMSNRMLEYVPGKMPEYISDRMPEKKIR